MLYFVVSTMYILQYDVFIVQSVQKSIPRSKTFELNISSVYIFVM